MQKSKALSDGAKDRLVEFLPIRAKVLPEGIESGGDDAVGKGGAGKGSSHTA